MSDVNYWTIVKIKICVVKGCKLSATGENMKNGLYSKYIDGRRIISTIAENRKNTNFLTKMLSRQTQICSPTNERNMY